MLRSPYLTQGPTVPAFARAVVTFLCRRQEGDLIVLLEQEFAVLNLPELPLLANEGLAGRDLY